MNGLISKETYSDYLQCLNEDLKKELLFNGLTVEKENGNLVINDKVIIRLKDNSHALIGITCLREPKNINGLHSLNGIHGLHEA